MLDRREVWLKNEKKQKRQLPCPQENAYERVGQWCALAGRGEYGVD
jgi:hypothetical protein